MHRRRLRRRIRVTLRQWKFEERVAVCVHGLLGMAEPTDVSHYDYDKMSLARTRWNVENNEMALVHQACSGDKEAYWRLVQPHLRAVVSIAMAILMNLAEAAEVAHEAVLRGLSNIQRFRGQLKFSTWLIQITINEARNRLRQDRRQELSQASEEGQTDNGEEYVPK